MKKIILSAALAAVLASPAFSQATPMLTQPQAYSSQRVTPAYSSQQIRPGRYEAYRNGSGAYAQYGNDVYAQQGYYGAGVVIEGGRIVGQDPDPNVRLELRRDQVSDD
jgi:opacity protein-like surface antigen